MRYLSVFLLATVCILFPPSASLATSCTPGTDCYRDCVLGPATVGAYKNAACHSKHGVGVPVDSSVLVVEDFEAPAYIQDLPESEGPWWAASVEFPTSRGSGSLWNTRYGPFSQGHTWTLGNPTNPHRGVTCGIPPPQMCHGGRVWHPTDLWGGGGGPQAMFAMLQAGQFNAEISSLPDPTRASGGGSGVFDGNVSLGWRNPAGAGSTQGIAGKAQFGFPNSNPGTGQVHTTFGITMAMAYPPNLTQDTVAKTAWKHNEWWNSNGVGLDSILVFGSTSGVSSTFPFYGFFTHRVDQPIGAFTITQCRTAVAAATNSTGRAAKWSPSCFTIGGLVPGAAQLTWVTAGSGYKHQTHWPLGQWACLRAFYQNMGLSNSAWWVELTTSVVSDMRVIDVANMDTSGFRLGRVPQGYSALAWNNSANANQPRARPSTVMTFRYEDNIHVRAGTPVSCAQIGYSKRD